MEERNVIPPKKNHWLSWPEVTLILGLVLLNLGVFFGNSKVVDSWLLFIVHYCDVRYWTWKPYAVLLILCAVIIDRSRCRHEGGRHCRFLIVAFFALVLLTLWQGWMNFSWNNGGRTVVVRQVTKGNRSSNEYTPLDYKIHLPIGYYNLGGRRPLIVFLHGAGGVGKDIEDELEDLTKHLTLEMKQDFPFVVISPASRKHDWKTSQILQILEETTTRWNIDTHRIYLTGFSMGGFGTFQAACDSPNTFAAIVPVSGGGNLARADRLKNLPTWAFHGDADEVVPYECSSKMIDAMKAAGCAEAKLTTLEGAGHGVMGDVYSRPEVYKWMLERRGGK